MQTLLFFFFFFFFFLLSFADTGGQPYIWHCWGISILVAHLCVNIATFGNSFRLATQPRSRVILRAKKKYSSRKNRSDKDWQVPSQGPPRSGSRLPRALPAEFCRTHAHTRTRLAEQWARRQTLNLSRSYKLIIDCINSRQTLARSVRFLSNQCPRTKNAFVPPKKDNNPDRSSQHRNIREAQRTWIAEWSPTHSCKSINFRAMVPSV